jgi:hypothetical protein
MLTVQGLYESGFIVIIIYSRTKSVLEISK